MMLRMGRVSRMIACVLGLCLGCAPALPAQTAHGAWGPAGTTWGGEHIRLQVTDKGAELEFDCASGTIIKPLATNAQGNFSLKGTFTREHPGPVMRDNPNTAATATYSGTIQGDAMHVSITSAAQNDGMGEYVLVRGQQGRVMKCK